VNEHPAYSNRTPYSSWYGIIGPWCAMFVSWVFWHANWRLPAIRTAKGFAYCPDIVNWAKRHGCWRSSSSGYVPKRGDIVLFDFIGRPSHVGIVTGLTRDGRVATIEGNTNAAGSRTGGSVMRHHRARRGSTIGYVEVTPTAATSGIPHEIIRPGATGPRVAAVQWTLNVLRPFTGRGHLHITDPAGYGGTTESVVRSFQNFARSMQVLAGETDEDRLVDVDGIWGPQTAQAAEFWVRLVP
jgi:hypothetical protein